jgi:ArsR family transcriptional regulator, arsenate/arsenite/antimonite-responsive transcriptional repressor / arsenate reductase (thioredoxin)
VSAPHDRDLERRASVHAALGDASRLRIAEAVALSDRAPSDLAAELGMPTNLLAHHLDVLEAAGVITRSRSHGDQRRRYVRLVPGTVRGMLAAPELRAREVLFVCSANSARSQLATALWRRHSPIPASSAGREPAPRVHRAAVDVAAAHGLDLAAATPRSYGEVRSEPDLVVSVCDLAGEASVPFPQARRLHWSIDDPVPVGRKHAFEDALRELEERVTVLAARTAPA